MALRSKGATDLFSKGELLECRQENTIMLSINE